MASGLTKVAGVALAASALVTATACGSGGDGGSGDSGQVTVEFWGAAVGMDKPVELWNKSNPDFQVKYSQIAPGSSGGYAKMQNAVKAGNAPCLGQVGYDTMPTFAALGALEDVSEYASASEEEFVEWSWQMTSVGEQVFGVPIDIGPMAMFYRADLYKKFGISPPKTWEEFEEAAHKVKAASPTTRLAATPQDAYDLGALTWQAGGAWFGTENDEWQVSIDSEATQQVAQYWQGLLDKDLVSTAPPFDTTWFKEAQDGQLLTLIGAAWAVPLLSTNLPDLSGKWAVAPMPQWNEGDTAAGNRGGSALAVLKGCEHLEEATEFATWFSTDAESLATQIQHTGIYPAAKSGLELPEANKPSEYFGGQNIYEVFKAAAENISPSWTWGPTMTQVQADFKDELKEAGAGGQTLPEAVTDVEASTLAAMASQGLSVGD